MKLKTRRTPTHVSHEVIDFHWIRFNSKRLPKEYDGYPGIYAIFDSDDYLIYIGQSINVYQRLKHHASKQYSYVSVLFVDKGFLNHLERHLIKKYKPIKNRTGVNNPGPEAGSFY